MPKCFIIGPIGDKFAPFGTAGRVSYEEALEVFERVIVPACEQHDLEPIRADQIAIAGEITEQIFRHLYEDEVVVADVTGGNPNVMYELGLRHTRDLLTIQISEYGQLPFDIAGGRTIQFSRSARGLIDARNELIQALAVGLTEGPEPMTATRLWALAANAFPEPVPVPVTTVDGQRADEEVDADGLLDRMVQIEESFPLITVTIEKISDIVNVMGTEADKSGRVLIMLNESNAPAAARLLQVGEFANTLQLRADDLSQLGDSFISTLKTIDTGVIAVLEFMRENPANTSEVDANAFLDGLIDLARSSRNGFDGLSQFASSVKELGPMSKSMRRPSTQIAGTVRDMARAAAIMDEWEAAASRLKQVRADAAAQKPFWT